MTYRPAVVQQSLKRGDTWVLEIEITGNDLSTYTWECQWRESASSSTVFATASVDTSQASSGVVAFTVPAATTGTISPPKSYVWDVQRTASGVVDTVLSGIVDVDWDVTR